jgi:beta-mannosidase
MMTPRLTGAEPVPDLLANAQWAVLRTRPGVVADPDGLPAEGDWIPAAVPGTVAGALREHQGEASARATDIDAHDWWWLTRVRMPLAHGPWLLELAGLATFADVWVNDQLVLQAENMFRSHIVELRDIGPSADIVIRCAAALPLVTRRLPRPRWKSPLVRHQGWRWQRTSLLGRIEGWGKGAPPVGPWRPVRLYPGDQPLMAVQRVAAVLEGDSGVVRAEFRILGQGARHPVRVHVGNADARAEGDGQTISVVVRLPEVLPWWPHTHGAQPLYSVRARVGGHSVTIARVGFRSINADTEGDEFGLRVNGVPVFARGACWMPLDPISLQATPKQVREAVTQARACGLNLLRIPGTGVYEDESFYAACDELGMLVWQDCMLAGLDPPATPEFTNEMTSEVGELADRLAGHPCLAVVSGGSETEQQPVLLGMPPETVRSPLIYEAIPAVISDRLPGVPYLPSTPTGGPTPIYIRSGVSHYFGVGAYLRPLRDAREARVRFAAECLAFSVPPEQESVREFFGASRVAGHDPVWKAGVPRDGRSAWDFEDVRDYYVRQIFGVDPMLIRYSNPDFYLDLGRAAVCIAMSEVFTQWRRQQSGNRGGIILALRDLVPGAGWGLIDSRGQAKAPWYAMRRILAPVAVLVSDDGLDGITVIAVNDGPQALVGSLAIRLWSADGSLASATVTDVSVPSQGAREWSLDALLGQFTDAGNAYRFGPQKYDALHACLSTPDGRVLADVVTLLGDHLRPRQRGGLTGILLSDPEGWCVQVTAERLSQWVAVSADGYLPSDAWFHLAPGMTKTIRLAPRVVGRAQSRPLPSLRALNVEELIVTGAARGAAGRDRS